MLNSFKRNKFIQYISNQLTSKSINNNNDRKTYKDDNSFELTEEENILNNSKLNMHSVDNNNMIAVKKWTSFKNNKENETSQAVSTYLPDSSFLSYLLLRFKALFSNPMTKADLSPNQLKNRVSVLQYAANDPIEDRFNAIQMKNIDGYLVSVLDGHGGWQAAEFVNSRLHVRLDEILVNLPEDKGLRNERIVSAIDETFNNIKGNVKVTRVGTCALSILVVDDYVFIANLGDCQAKLFSHRNDNNRSFTNINTNYKSFKLSNIMNASSISEQTRLHQNFKKEEDIIVFKNGTYYVKGRLQPTRTIGDFYLKKKEFNNALPELNRIRPFRGPYIDHHPEIITYQIKKNDEFIIIATDGLWDFMSSDEICQIIKENRNNKENIAQELFNKTMSRAAEDADLEVAELFKIPPGKYKRSIHDDFTVLVLDIKNQAV